MLCPQHAYYTIGGNVNNFNQRVAHIHGTNGHRLCNWNFSPFYFLILPLPGRQPK